MRRGLSIIVALAALLLAGCVPSPQDDPVPIAVPPATTAATDRPPAGGSEAVTLYFLEDGRLQPVRRQVFDTSPAERLELLLAGPTAAEAAAGIRTAVAAGSLASATYSAPHTSVVHATPGFARISGPDQLLALAQVVWTLTEHPATSQVSLIVDGTAVEVPTDHGLSKVPVRRGEYASVAPVEPPAPTPSVGTASPSTSSGRQGAPVPRPTSRGGPAQGRVRRAHRSRPSRGLRRSTR